MGNAERILDAVLSGKADRNTAFSDLCGSLVGLGFASRVKGSHHIVHRDGIDEIVNIQPDGAEAKPYQVKQVRSLFLKYKLEVRS
jgi:predicted RNA binding protein YcfA (HicA-like mRNA interferase family)